MKTRHVQSSDFKKRAALAAFPACLEASFRVAERNEPAQAIGAIMERAALWAEWAADKLEEVI